MSSPAFLALPAAAPLSGHTPVATAAGFADKVAGELAQPAQLPQSGSSASQILLGGSALALGAAAAQRSSKQRRSARAAGAGVRPYRIARRDGAAAGGKKIGCVGIVGASGAVGQEMLKCLETRNFATEKVRLFAKRAAGQVVKSSAFGDITIEPFTVEAAQECEICLMAVSGGFSQEFSPQIKGGPKDTAVIDNSSAFRYDDEIPLVVPEINGGELSTAPLIANPNCTTAIGAMALWPLHQKYKLKKVIMSTYQAASGAGAEGMAELEAGLKAYVTDGEVSAPEVFAHQLPFNVIPQIDAFQENGYTKEEMKVSWELQKIFGLSDDVKVSCTAVRVPTLRAHSESIVIETEEKVDPKEALEVLRAATGVKVVDDPAKLEYPMPLNATGQYDVEVGRVRQSIIFGDHGLEFFVSGDQLLRGAALNAVIIAEQAVAARLA